MTPRSRIAAWLVLVGALAALNFGGRAAAGDPERDLLYRYSTAVSTVVLLLIVLAVVLAICGGRFGLLALRRPASWSRAGGLAVLVLLVVIGLNAALEPLLHAGREQGLTPERWDGDRAGAYVANAIVVAGLTPLVEELTFRGLGLSLLEGAGRLTAALLTAFGWAAAHGIAEAVPILAVFGLGLAYLRIRTGSVYPGILLHACFNTIALALAVTT